jgi:uncharacterized membrane protein
VLLNPFRINDWKLSEALKVVFITLAILWALIGLDALGICLPLARGVVGVGYLLLVPGILVLRVLRAHQLDSVRTTLFAVGLSIATVMGIGLFMNVVYPLFGIEQPLTLVPVVGTVSAATVVLAAASYWRDRDFADDAEIDRQRVLSPSILFLCLLPFVAIFATHAMNVYSSNIGLLGLLVIIAATALWVCTSPSFPKEGYPLAVFAIALAMLFFASLISSNVWGWDSQKELYSANLVLTSGAWNSSLTESTNAVASVTLLAPFLSLTSGVSVTWLFKIVYPLVFALVPLAIFVTVRSQTNDKIAFISAFFVTSLFTFFGEMPALARQEIAEFFLVLLLILIVDKYRSAVEKRRVFALFAVFAGSLVISHYALALIYLAYISLAWLFLFLVDNPALGRLRRSAQNLEADRQKKTPRMLKLVFVLAFAAFTAAWYLSFGSAASAAIRTIVDQILSTIAPATVVLVIGVGAVAYAGAFALTYAIAARRLRTTGTWVWVFAAAPLALFVTPGGWGQYYYGASLNDVLQVGTLLPIHELGLTLYVLSVLLIVVGLGAVLALRSTRWRFDVEYVTLALASLAVLVVATIVPMVAFSINMTRLFHISTLVLAPFCVTGGLLIAQSVVRLITKSRETGSSTLVLRIVAAFFVTLFLFSSGFVYEVTNQGSTSFVLNSGVDAPVFNDREVAAGQWLNDTRGSVASGGPLIPIYADAHRRALFDRFDLYHPATHFYTFGWAPPNSYVFLGTFNVERWQTAEIAATTLLGGTGISYIFSPWPTEHRSKIFDDGGAAIYYRRIDD